MIYHMAAMLVIRERMVFEDGAVIEIKVWRLENPVPASRHRLKYSLYYGQGGERLVGYDNERGKGDHRHFGGREESYRFRSVERLLADFKTDVERLRGEKI